jgi:transposase InsO family protein
MEVGMPWKGATVVERRFEFVLRVRSGSEPISHLCREFGISRKTGHKWLQRYEVGRSVTALIDQSRRPHQSPDKTPRAHEERVVELRKLYGWSGRKLRKLLRAEGIELSRSTIDRIIDRNGLIEKRDRHRPAVNRFERSQPNELWQMDFKGEYILRGVERCYPLSLLDDHSRFSVGLFPLRTPNGSQVRRCVVECFEEFGVPQAMLMDHGTPWWQSNNGHGLTHFSVDLIKQGIQLIYGSVGHPQTQGKVERFHQTMKRSLRHRGVPQDFAGMGRALREFRHVYNEIRPHQALDDETPASRYMPSKKAYEPCPREWSYPEGADVRKLNSSGCLDYKGGRSFVSEALAGERVWCRRIDDLLVIRYRQMYVREIDLSTGRTTAVVRPVETENL